MSSIRNELNFLKTKLEEIDLSITKKISEAEEKTQTFYEADNLLKEFIKSNDKIITLNVGGKCFQTKLSTLISFKDSLFYVLYSKYILQGKEIPSTFFFDRNYTYFPLIMDYIRTKYLYKDDLSKKEKDELQIELMYYGLVQPNKSVNEKQINLVWSKNLSKVDACTIDPDDSSFLKVHSQSCYTHFVTDFEFTDENVQVEFDMNVYQTDNYFYVGVVNESYSFTSNCLCTCPPNAFFIKCDGNTYMNATPNNHPDYAWNSQEVIIGFKLFTSSKKLYIYRDDLTELGPFKINGNKFRFVSGHCNRGNGTIKITKSMEIIDNISK